MHSKILVTGATGSVGSNVCRLAVSRGAKVKALVRSDRDADALADLGAEPVLGDVTDAPGLAEAAQGVDGIIHCAAQIGGTWSTVTPEQFLAVNQQGSFNVFDAAEAAGGVPTVQVLSAIVYDMSHTITEDSPLKALDDSHSPYTRSKLAAYYEGMARAARGAPITFVVPAGVYGPTPLVERALVPTIFTGTLLMAARGELTRYLPMPISWVLAEDVAEISLRALDRGRPGRRYLALGRPEDTRSLPAFCNTFLGMAGIAHRVEEFDPTGAGATQDPEFGSMVKMLQSTYPSPSHDPSTTTEQLGYAPTSLADGLRDTLAWLRQHGRI